MQNLSVTSMQLHVNLSMPLPLQGPASKGVYPASKRSTWAINERANAWWIVLLPSSRLWAVSSAMSMAMVGLSTVAACRKPRCHATW